MRVKVMHTETNNVKVGYGKAIILSAQMRSEGMGEEMPSQESAVYSSCEKTRSPAARSRSLEKACIGHNCLHY